MVKRILRQCGRLLRMREVLRRIDDACVVRCGGLRLSVTVGAERVVEIVYYGCELSFRLSDSSASRLNGGWVKYVEVAKFAREVAAAGIESQYPRPDHIDDRIGNSLPIRSIAYARMGGLQVIRCPLIICYCAISLFM